MRKRAQRSRKRIVRYSLLAANVALLLAVIGFVTYETPAKTTGQSALSITSVEETARANPLDQLSSADIAVNIALLADLDETVAIVNHADSVSAQMTVTPADEALAAKPQIVSTELKSKNDIIKHSVKSGETVTEVARQYGVTADSVRWSNGLSGDTLQANQSLYIPPVDGIVYLVKAGDTIDSLVQRYSANKAQLIADNDAEVGGLKIGERILIRGGVQQAAPSYSGYSFAYNYIARYGGNGYVPGYCTYYVASRIAVPTNWGDARTWAVRARMTPGWTVSKAPRPGSIAQTTRMHYLGHVAVVEEVSEDGSMIKYSDMNGLAGYGRVGSSGWVSAGMYDYYIHR